MDEWVAGINPAMTKYGFARGIVAVHLEVDGQNERARAAYARAGFSSRDKYHVVSLVL
jgi:RimJ/RimL family protein N-acetyltransferase